MWLGAMGGVQEWDGKDQLQRGWSESAVGSYPFPHAQITPFLAVGHINCLSLSALVHLIAHILCNLPIGS